MQKEIRVEARIRNNILWHAIFDLWPSVAAFCREEDFSETTVGQLLNLKTYPLGTNGEFLPSCKRLAEILGFSCEQLFPLKIYEVNEVSRVVEIGLNELNNFCQEPLMLPSPCEVLLKKELLRELERLVHALPYLEQRVVILRFGLFGNQEHTLKETGKKLEPPAGREKTRYIEAKALYRLRHSSANRTLNFLRDCNR